MLIIKIESMSCFKIISCILVKISKYTIKLSQAVQNETLNMPVIVFSLSNRTFFRSFFTNPKIFESDMKKYMCL